MRYNFVTILTILLLLTSKFNFAYQYKVGILAKDGKEKCLQEWKSTGDYLNFNISNHICEIIPIEYNMIFNFIENQKIDFIILNPLLYTTTKKRYQTKAIATILNDINGIPVKEFGGVIFTAKENILINTLEDIKGKTFVAVSQNSFGGWLMAYKEFIDNNISPFKDFNKLLWVKNHELAVMQVLIGEADAGTVRTSTLERMIDRELIQKDEIKVLNSKTYLHFPFLVSTTLYPEWPLLKLKHTDEILSKEVVDTLKKITPNDLAAKSAKIMGWIDPLNYDVVDHLEKSIKIDEFIE